MRPVRPPVPLPHSHIDLDWTCAGVPIQSRSVRLSCAEMRLHIYTSARAKGNELERPVCFARAKR
jgi:hypothetical protein